MRLNTTTKVLKAYQGDSILITTFDSNKNEFTILIDGGPRTTFKTLIRELTQVKRIDLLILTHIDNDHIGGLIQLLSSDRLKEVEIERIMMNSPNLCKVSGMSTQVSTDDGIEFEKLIMERLPYTKVYSKVTIEDQLDFNLPDGIEIKILSPNREALQALKNNWEEIDLETNISTQISSSIKTVTDYEIEFDELAKRRNSEKKIDKDFANAFSIAFTLKTNKFTGLFLGDSHPSIVLEGLNSNFPNLLPLKFDIVKLSHHGSKYSVSNNLLDAIISNNYIISTHGGVGRSKHPDRETIAKIVCHQNMNKEKNTFYFNYSLKEIESRIGKLFSDIELKQFNVCLKNDIVL